MLKLTRMPVRAAGDAEAQLYLPFSPCSLPSAPCSLPLAQFFRGGAVCRGGVGDLEGACLEGAVCCGVFGGVYLGCDFS